MKISINYDTHGPLLEACLDDVKVAIPVETVRRLHRVLAGGVSGDDVAGFFDFAKKALHVLGSIAKNPVVKAVAGVVPYAGTALAVIEAGDSALKSAESAITKRPELHRAIRDAARGNPVARQALQHAAAAGPKAKKILAGSIQLQQHARELKRQVDQAKAMLHHAGYTPALIQALHRASEPVWRVTNPARMLP